MLNKTIRVLLTVCMVASVFSGLTFTAVSADSSEFQISGVEIADSRTLIVNLSEEMNTHLWDYMDQVPTFHARYITISGGAPGEADAAFNGATLDQIANTRVYGRDDRKSFEILIGNGASPGAEFVAGRQYEIQIVGNPFESITSGAPQSADTYWYDVNGVFIDKEAVGFSAAAVNPAAPWGIESVIAEDDGSAVVVFSHRVVTGAPTRVTNANRISVTGASAAAANYVERLDGGNGRAYRAYFNSALVKDGDYVLNAAAQFGGPFAAAGATSKTFKAGVNDFNVKLIGAIATQSSDNIRTEIELSFDANIYQIKKDGGYVGIFETPVAGAVGQTITRGQLNEIFNLGGINFGAAISADAIVGYFKDSKTIILHNDNKTALSVANNAQISLKAGGLKGWGAGQAENAAGAAVAVSKETGGAAIAAGYNPASTDYLSMTRQNITFRHHDYDYDQYDGVKNPLSEGIDPRLQIVAKNTYIYPEVVEREFNTYVIENKYIKATFLPEFGARMLSLIYKPTGEDLLFLNEVGTPYGQGFSGSQNPAAQRGNSPFYSNWLMVWGGVFPTFSQPEHGKFWYQPYEYSIEETEDAITITQTVTDDIEYRWANQPRFADTATDLTLTASYTVYKDKAYVDYNVSIYNPTDEAKYYEYWTCTTLGPGEDTYYGSATMEIVAPTQVLMEDGYNWIINTGEPVQAYASVADAPAYVARVDSGSFNYRSRIESYRMVDKLNKFYNWTSSGIAYGQDLARLPQADWWGVINQSNQQGVIRVADNKITPGLKYWLWAYNGSFDTRPYASRGSSSRPYIELWAGASNKFFDNAYLKAGDTTSWTETYLPTAGLYNVTNATKDGAAEIKFVRNGGNTYNVTADVFSLDFGKEMTAKLYLDGFLVEEENFIPDPLSTFTIEGNGLEAGGKAELEIYPAGGSAPVLTAWAVQGSLPEPEVIAVSGVSLNKTEVRLNEGARTVLFPVIEPFNADLKEVIWETSDPSVVSLEIGRNWSGVNANNQLSGTGLNYGYPGATDFARITGAGDGTATITVRTKDGNFSVSATVTVGAPLISFDSNGGTDVSPIELTAGPTLADNGYTNAAQLPQPVKGGEAFAGWYEEATFDTPVSTTKAYTTDTTFYAKYQAADVVGSISVIPPERFVRGSLPDDIITYNFDVSGIGNIAAGSFDLSYDDTKLEYVGADAAASFLAIDLVAAGSGKLVFISEGSGTSAVLEATPQTFVSLKFRVLDSSAPVDTLSLSVSAFEADDGSGLSLAALDEDTAAYTIEAVNVFFDLTGDGVFNLSDIVFVRDNLGVLSTDSKWTDVVRADFDGDSEITLADFNYIINAYLTIR
jgi:uncharacterized protein YjdB